MAAKVVKVTKEILETNEEQNKYDPDQLSDNFKGRLVIMNPEQSEIAKNLKITKKGTFAIKI